MRIVTIAAIIAALATTAYAQPRGVSPDMGNPNVKSEAQKAADEKQRKADEKAYKDSVSRIPDRDLKLDPWAKIR